MKKTFLLVTGLAGFCALHAQVKEGTILYEQKINLHRSITDEQMKAMLPEFRTAKYSLTFSDSVSIYKLVPEDEAPDPFAGNGLRMVFRGPGGGGDLYKNFAQSKSVRASEMGGKNFLIVDSIRQQPWKIGTETRQILGYTCHRATRKVPAPRTGIRMVTTTNGDITKDTTANASAPRETEVVAWFADDLISPAGPENFGQLPGVVLLLDMDNGMTVYTATEVRKTADQKELKEPKKGKVVTPQEYAKMMQELMGMPGGSGATIRFGG